ncbi:MAG: penicillin-binding transpeptidase domain-containing protein [Anaerohalosphaeraceae bacterium]
MLVCLGRLWYLQYFMAEPAREQLGRIRILPPKSLPTLRGKILDRNERIVARDEPYFYLQINYELTRLQDPRFWETKVQERTAAGQDKQAAEEKLAKDWAKDIARLKKAMDFCMYTAGMPQEELNQTIEAINDRIWELARFICWRRNHSDAPTSQYEQEKEQIPSRQIAEVDLSEMHKGYSVLELFDRPTLMAAQVELSHVEGVKIQSESRRTYPYGAAASHLVGWVGPVRREEADTLFSDDAYLRYLDGEIIGKFGIEKFGEAILRGKRGEVTYDRDKNEIARTNPQFGQDIQLTLDMVLQRDVETLLSDPNAAAPGFGGNGKIAAVVIEAATGDILTMASLPNFDVNKARQLYGELLKDPSRPLMNRAMEETFPPGSSVKPLIMLAGLEENKITADEVISCSWTLPPSSWPKCLLQRRGYCHDSRWEEEGQVNNGRNALRGSCNVYFSRLADRLDANALQRWLWEFGWGTTVLQPCISAEKLAKLDVGTDINSEFREAPGSIIADIQTQSIEDIATVKTIPPGEKRWWGIGQGNLRATVLQVANAYVALARRGEYKPPRLVIDSDDPMNSQQTRRIPIHAANLGVLYDGMHAVVNERGGSAYEAFADSGLNELGLNIFGKTGSTERPFNAWFAAFVTDSAGRAIALAVVVEEGQSGGKDAAPLAREIIRLCHQAGFIGTKTTAP